MRPRLTRRRRGALSAPLSRLRPCVPTEGPAGGAAALASAAGTGSHGRARDHRPAVVATPDADSGTGAGQSTRSFGGGGPGYFKLLVAGARTCARHARAAVRKKYHRTRIKSRCARFNSDIRASSNLPLPTSIFESRLPRAHMSFVFCVTLRQT